MGAGALSSALKQHQASSSKAADSDADSDAEDEYDLELRARAARAAAGKSAGGCSRVLLTAQVLAVVCLWVGGILSTCCATPGESQGMGMYT